MESEIKNPVKPFQDELVSYEIFYAQALGQKFDAQSGLIIPPRPTFEDSHIKTRLLVLLKGMTPMNIVQSNKTECLIVAKFDWEYVEIKNSDVNRTYAVWVYDSPDVDRLLKGSSQSDLRSRPTESLSERLLHGLKHFHEGRGHLDVYGKTITSSTIDVYYDKEKKKRKYSNMALSVQFHAGRVIIDFLSPQQRFAGGGREILSRIER